MLAGYAMEIEDYEWKIRI